MSKNFKISLTIKFVLLGLLLVFVLASTGFTKGKKPNGGGGDPISINIGDPIYVDGHLGDWGSINDTCFPLYWAGQKNKSILATVCLRYDADAGILYVKGTPTENHVINWKPDSVHLKLNKIKLWEDYDYPPDGYLPEYAADNLQTNDGGFPVIDGFEASAYVEPGRYSMIAHISIFPFGEWADALGGQSSRTLRGLEILINTSN